jgi:hypothetical protein
MENEKRLETPVRLRTLFFSSCGDGSSNMTLTSTTVFLFVNANRNGQTLFLRALSIAVASK